MSDDSQSDWREEDFADTFVEQCEFYSSIPSTNDLALQRARAADSIAPFLILADEQSAGRGRGNNRWWSGSGALTFSLILEPLRYGIPQFAWPRIALTAGLSVCELLDDLVPHAVALLKWPNDVLLERRKVCGILVEVPACPPEIAPRLVLGIGINLNNSLADAPDEVKQRAIAVCDAAGVPLNRRDFLQQLLIRLEANLKELGESPLSLGERWQSACALRGRIVTIDQGSQTVSGCCAGLALDGGLLIETSREVVPVYNGTVAAITDSSG